MAFFVTRLRVTVIRLCPRGAGGIARGGVHALEVIGGHEKQSPGRGDARRAWTFVPMYRARVVTRTWLLVCTF